MKPLHIEMKLACRPIRWPWLRKPLFFNGVTPAQAKRILSTRGWTQRRAARELGYNWTNLCKVLSGARRSKRLLNRIAELKQYQPTEAGR
jgi:hypothetical protein